MYWLTGFAGTQLPRNQPDDDISTGQALNSVVQVPGGRVDAFGQGEAPLIPRSLTKSSMVNNLARFKQLRSLVGKRGALVRAAPLVHGADPVFGFYYPLSSPNEWVYGGTGYEVNTYNNLGVELSETNPPIGTPITDLSTGSLSGYLVGSTNLFPYPSGDYNVSGAWTAVGGGITYVSSQVLGFPHRHPIGSVFELRAGDSNQVYAEQTVTVIANTDYQVSVDLQSVSSFSEARVEILSGGSGPGSTIVSHADATDLSSWVRQVVNFNSGSDTSIKIRLIWHGSTGTKLQFNAVLLVENGSPYFDGDTPNCSWSGTAGASTSTVDSAGILSQTLWSKTEPQQLTVAFWTKVLAWDDSVTPGAILGLSGLSAYVSFGAVLASGTTPNHFITILGSTRADIDTGIPVVIGEWVHIALVLDGEDYSAYVNGVLTNTGTFTRYDVTGEPHLSLEILSSQATSDTLPCEVSAVFITESALSSSTISQLASTPRSELIEELIIDARCTDLVSKGREDSLFYGVVNMIFETLGVWHGGETRIKEVTGVSSGSITLDNEGDATETDLLISGTANASSITLSIDNPVFSMTLSGLSAGDTFEIDCRNRTVRVNGADAYSNTTIATSNETALWFPIPASGCTFSYSSTSALSLKLVWRDAYK